MEIILEVARKSIVIPELIFILCGEGAVRSILEEKAKGLPNIRFYPLQPFERLNDLLNLADIHLLPQRADAADLVMPSKLSGMLASGKVVVAIASPESELGSIVSEVGLLTPPGNVGALSEAIHMLAKNQKQRETLGERGRRWVVSHWAKEKVLHVFEAHLGNMLEL